MRAASARVQMAVGRQDTDTVGWRFPLPAQRVVESVINPLPEHLETEPDRERSPAASRRGEHASSDDYPEVPQREAHKDGQQPDGWISRSCPRTCLPHRPEGCLDRWAFPSTFLVHHVLVQ